MLARRRMLFVFGVLAVAAACSLPSSNDFAKNAAPAPGADAAVDGPSRNPPGLPGGGSDAAADAAEGGDGGDAGDAGAIVDLLPADDSTFESGTCGQDTGGFQSVLASSTVAHTGAGACRVCRGPTTDNDTYSIDTGLALPPAIGAEYRATAWVRRPPGASDTAQVTFSMRTHDGDYVAVEQVDSNAVQLTDEYTVISLVLDVTKRANDMDVFVGSTPPAADASACFLIDDLVVWRAK